MNHVLIKEKKREKDEGDLHMYIYTNIRLKIGTGPRPFILLIFPNINKLRVKSNFQLFYNINIYKYITLFITVQKKENIYIMII